VCADTRREEWVRCGHADLSEVDAREEEAARRVGPRALRRAEVESAAGEIIRLQRHVRAFGRPSVGAEDRARHNAEPGIAHDAEHPLAVALDRAGEPDGVAVAVHHTDRARRDGSDLEAVEAHVPYAVGRGRL